MTADGHLDRPHFVLWLLQLTIVVLGHNNTLSMRLRLKVNCISIQLIDMRRSLRIQSSSCLNIQRKWMNNENLMAIDTYKNDSAEKGIHK